MPTIKFVVDGVADRAMRDSQQSSPNDARTASGAGVGAWRRGSVTAVLRRIDGPQPRWAAEDVRTSAGLDPQLSEPAEQAAVGRRSDVGATGWLRRTWQTITPTGSHGREVEVDGT